MTDDTDAPVGSVFVEFVCTDRGSHAPVKFGYVAFDELDDEEPITPVSFIRTRGTAAGEYNVTSRLDDRCPRCGRHPRYNDQTLRKIAAGVLAMNLEEARQHPAVWGNHRRTFRRTVDVSSPMLP